MSALFRSVVCFLLIALAVAAGCSSQPAQKTGTGPLAGASPALGTITSPVGSGGSSGTCGSVDFDPQNCGKCGAVCPENAVCSGGNCYCRDGYRPDNGSCVALPPGTTSACPAGMSPCGNTYCYELQFDRANCGLCGFMCPSGKTCSAGTCTAVVAEPTGTPVASGGSCDVPGQTKCGSRCVNTTTNIANCGSCGKMCQTAAPNCCSGACVDFSKDTANCGACGHHCPSGATCSLGSCRIKVTGIVYSSITVQPSFVR